MEFALQSVVCGLLSVDRALPRRAGKLIESEGADWFAARQRFLVATGNLARKKRLSRFYYVAEKTRT
jgi:hypothetical protein